MRAIVAGVDLTVMGRRVADRAGMIAGSCDADLQLVHVLEPVGEAMIDTDLARLLRNHQIEEAERLQKWVGDRTQANVSLEVPRGSPSWDLVARAKKADLVVVGSSSVDAFGVGPVSRRVARMSVTDALIVRRQPRVPYRRIIAAVDFSEASRLTVDRARDLFPDAEITVMFSLPSRFDALLADAGLFTEEVQASRESRLLAARDRMDEFVADWDNGLRTLVVDGPPTETVEEVVRRRNADLVMVSARGASATRMVLMGTVAEGLVGRAPCDVMVVRAGSSFRRP